MDTNRLPRTKDEDDDGADTLGICRTCRHAFTYSARVEQFPFGPPSPVDGDEWKKATGERKRQYFVLCRHPVMLSVTELGATHPRQLSDPVASCDGHEREP